MVAFASKTLLDYAAASIVLTPAKIDSNGVAKWVQSSVSVFDARASATLLVKEPKNGSNVARVSGKIVVPVMDPIDTTVKVAECICTYELVLPKQASLTQRRDLLAMAKSDLDHATVEAAVENIESIY
jgi:hypothetical protein